MSAQIEALNTYLAEKKKALDSDRILNLVLGNDASDLDSMASSVMYAYYAGRARADENGPVYLPLINIPRADFKLRTEAVYLFDATGIELENLLFADEADLDRLQETNRLRLTLVDHNKLAPSQCRYQELVEAIVDHHEDEGLYSQITSRTIEPVGSAASLIAEKILKDKPELIDEGTGKLLLGPILLDTVNLDPKEKRVTPKDEGIAGVLVKRTAADQKALFNKLQFEKFNVSSLETYDLLRKDYKEWQVGAIKYGIGSVRMPLKAWIEKDPDITAGFESYLKERDLHLLLAMNAYTDPDFHRDLAVYSPDAGLREKVITHLETSGLGLKPINPQELKGKGHICFFVQGDLSKSRKKLQPILSDFFSR
jgi:exopolyphosphatase